MQTTFQYQQKINNQKSIRYVLPGSLQDTYKKYDSNMQEILRDTQRCPFTSIRQLIITFKRNDPYSSDVQLSDLLSQQYRSRPQLQLIDKQLSTCITQAQQSQLRLKKLSICADTYINFHSQLTKSDESLLGEYSANQNQIQANERLQRKMNKNALEKQNKYFECLTYSQELQRALTLGSLTQSQKLQPQTTKQSQLVNNINSFQQLSVISTSMCQQLDKNIYYLQEQLFLWREKSKHGAISNQHFTQPNQAIKQWKNKNNQFDNAYLQMGNFVTWLEQDRNQLTRIHQSNRRSYQSFLPKYIKAREVYEISSHNSAYHNIIKEQKKKLQMHLRAHYGLIVPYVVSDEYTKMISPLQNPRNSQVKQLVADELIPLEQGLNYVNGDYEKLYRDACDDVNGKLRVKGRIEEFLNKFAKYSENPDQDNAFSVHLIQSCRKLLRIAR